MRRLSLLCFFVILSLTVGATALAQTPDDPTPTASEASPADTELAPSVESEAIAPDSSPAPIAEPTNAPPVVLLSLTPQARQTPDPSRIEGRASGIIDGNRAGSFAYASFYYPGDGSVSRITVTYSPNDIAANNGFGLNLLEYTKVGMKLQGAGSSPGSAAGTSWIDYYSRAFKGNVTIQLYNYNPSGTITYGLSLTRLAPTT